MLLVVKSSGNEIIDKALKRVDMARLELHNALRELSNVCEDFEIEFVQEIKENNAASGN